MNQKNLTGRIYYWLLLGYFSILPMSQTIALRNSLLFALVFLFLVDILLFRKRNKLIRINYFRHIPLIFLLWIGYLIVFPFLAIQGDVAWVNLRGQWFQSILAFVVGSGAVMLLGKRGPGLWALSFASSFPKITGK